MAEAGAEDGAGAQLRIDEPWKGYDQLRAGDIVERISGADAAELAAVELYEQLRPRPRRRCSTRSGALARPAASVAGPIRREPHLELARAASARRPA